MHVSSSARGAGHKGMSFTLILIYSLLQRVILSANLQLAMKFCWAVCDPNVSLALCIRWFLCGPADCLRRFLHGLQAAKDFSCTGPRAVLIVSCMGLRLPWLAPMWATGCLRRLLVGCKLPNKAPRGLQIAEQGSSWAANCQTKFLFGPWL